MPHEACAPVGKRAAGRRPHIFSKELDATVGLLSFDVQRWETEFGRVRATQRQGEWGPLMGIAITASSFADRQKNGTFECSGAVVRAHCRHLATIVTIRGEIDAVNVDQVTERIQHFIHGTNPVVLDVGDVSHFSPAGISLLAAIDEECHAAGAEWTLVAGPAVVELLGEDMATMFPVAHSVHEALRNLAEANSSRRQLMLSLVRKTA
ncbi:hypothetical protein NJB1507_18080 [Mycobacterium marinum]|nr:hypothetical protein NJB1507_18080 [Mycobacterium marinum]